jgi:hypothetical protein
MGSCGILGLRMICAKASIQVRKTMKYRAEKVAVLANAPVYNCHNIPQVKCMYTENKNESPMENNVLPPSA